jgi:hypothetical protein
MDRAVTGTLTIQGSLPQVPTVVGARAVVAPVQGRAGFRKVERPTALVPAPDRPPEVRHDSGSSR